MMVSKVEKFFLHMLLGGRPSWGLPTRVIQNPRDCIPDFFVTFHIRFVSSSCGHQQPGWNSLPNSPRASAARLKQHLTQCVRSGTWASPVSMQHLFHSAVASIGQGDKESIMSQSIPTGYIPPRVTPGKIFLSKRIPGKIFCLIPCSGAKNDGRIPRGGAKFSQTRRNCCLSLQKNP